MVVSIGQKIKLLINKLLFTFAFFLIWLLHFLPTAWVKFLGNGLGSLAYFLAPKRRKVGMLNLNLCFPEMEQEKKQVIIKEHFKMLMISVLNYSLVFFGSRRQLKKLVKFKNKEILDKYYTKRPVIILCPHFVGLDLAASRIAVQGYEGCSIYSKQKSEIVTKKLLWARTKFMSKEVGKIFARQEGIKPIVRHLKKHRALFFYLPDQDFGERDSLYVPFFAHRNCATVKVLPKLVAMTDAIVVPMSVFWLDDHYEVEFYEGWEDYPSVSLYNDVLRVNQFIEMVVVKQLAQYFWLHKRFKTQPNMERGALYKC